MCNAARQCVSRYCSVDRLLPVARKPLFTVVQTRTITPVLVLSYRTHVPDLQGFVIRCRHQEVGVRGPGHIRYALNIHIGRITRSD